MEQRGYGANHRRVRAEVARAVDAGRVVCWRCGERIIPGEPWDLGHDDSPRAKALGIYRGPEHRHCSRSAGALKRQGITMPPRRGIVSDQLRHRGPSALDFFNTTDDHDEQPNYGAAQQFADVPNDGVSQHD